jgi:CubicO group peptidase (beta-lactamase class C family)
MRPVLGENASPLDIAGLVACVERNRPMTRLNDRGHVAVRRVVTVGAVLALLAVTGCSDDDDSGAESSPSKAPTKTSPAPTSTPAAATSAAATSAPATSAPATTATYDFSAIDPIVKGFVDQHGLNGAGLIVVDRDDGIVDEEYWGAFGPDRISLIASSTKMITAGVLLRLQDEGLLDIDKPVSAVAPWGTGNPSITPAQLLSNSSGLVGLLPNPGYAPYLCQYMPAGTLQDCAAGIFTTPADDADIVAPDTEFRYGGAQWQVAGAVAEIASGKTWAELIDETYVRPCGLQTLGFNNHFAQLGAVSFDYPKSFNADPATLQPTDNPNMEGGAYLAPGDYAKLLLMHLRGGRCDGGQVLSQAALDRMHADRIGPAYGGATPLGSGYGMGWWVDRATGRLTDPGAYGAVPWLDLDDGYGAYLVIEADSGTGFQLASLLFDAVDSAVKAH